MLNAYNGHLRLPAGETDYIRFGRGTRPLVILPGLGDGLATVKGLALPFALQYRSLSREFTVYVISRPDPLAPGTDTRAMAEALHQALAALGITGTAVVGVSQGGMVAQWLALDHPEEVRRLVLAVTLGRPNATVEAAVETWCAMARRGDYRGLLLDTAERSYSPKKLRSARLSAGLVGRVGKPRSFDRFLTQAAACLHHDAWEALPRIGCPTLVIGGGQDKIVTGEASRELAGRIPGARLWMVPELGHGLYEEAPDFWDRVAAFCRE